MITISFNFSRISDFLFLARSLSPSLLLSLLLFLPPLPSLSSSISPAPSPAFPSLPLFLFPPFSSSFPLPFS